MGAPKICTAPLISLSLKDRGLRDLGKEGLRMEPIEGGGGTGKGDSELSSRAMAGNTDT